MQNTQLLNLQNFVRQLSEKIIIIDEKDLIVFATENFLENIGLKKADVYDQKYQRILNYDISLNNFYILVDNQKMFFTEIDQNIINPQYKLFLFTSCCSIISEDILVDDSVIFDSIPDILSVHDTNHKVLYYNKAGYEFLNKKEGEVIGEKCYEIIGEKTKCEYCPASMCMLTGKASQKIKFFDNFNKWLDIRAYPIKDKDGKIVQIIEHLRDITEQKELELKYHDSEVKLRLLMENIPGIVYRCKNDINWTMLFMSEETKHITGYNSEDFILNDTIAYEDIIHPDDKAKVRKSVSKGVHKSKSFIIEYRIITKKGKIKYVWEKGKVITTADEEYVDGVILDISERKQIETDLKLSEEKHRLLIENQNELIIKLDKHGRLLYVNKTYCKTFGKAEEDLLNTNFLPVVHTDDKLDTNLAMTRLKNYPHTCYIEHRAMTANGWKWLAWSNKALMNNNDDIIEIIGVGRDITEKKIMEYELVKAKEKAERNDKLKTVFLNNVSQKIQKPINELIELNLDLSSEKVSLQTKLDLKKFIFDLHNYIRNLSEISKIETGQASTNYENFDLNQLINEVTHTVKTDYSQHKINFLIKKEIQGSFIIFSDKIKIKQILLHLLSNAFKYTTEGVVILEYTLIEDSVDFLISDTGVGINNTDLKSILDWIDYVDKDSSKTTKGFGIPISKAYVSLLNGDMNIKSQIGEGTNIKIRIPVKEKAYNKQDPRPQIKSVIPDLNALVILVAEDEKINFQLLKTILSKAGARVLRAQTGTEAVEIVKSNDTIALVLMDIKMPGLSGSEALIEIKKIKPELKVVACTAFTQSEDSDSFKKNNFDGFLPKPIKRQELFKIIKKLT